MKARPNSLILQHLFQKCWELIQNLILNLTFSDFNKKQNFVEIKAEQYVLLF